MKQVPNEPNEPNEAVTDVYGTVVKVHCKELNPHGNDPVEKAKFTICFNSQAIHIHWSPQANHNHHGVAMESQTQAQSYFHEQIWLHRNLHRCQPTPSNTSECFLHIFSDWKNRASVMFLQYFADLGRDLRVLYRAKATVQSVNYLYGYLKEIFQLYQ
jgi:hypothetical protein